MDLHRFFKKHIQKDPVTKCHIWIGSLGTRNYGMFYFKGKRYRAHRLSYELFVGPIPIDFYICHHCDNPQCVNPDHLFIGTQKDNMRDMIAKKRARWQRPDLKGKSKLHCPKGHLYNKLNTLIPKNPKQGKKCRQCALIYRRSLNHD